MDKNDDKRHQSLVEELAHCAATAATDGSCHLLQPWRQLALHLSPLIGESGFCALFSRAGRLVATHHGWLASPTFKTIDGLIAALGDSLKGVPADVAREGNAALLDSFVKLLSDLIGEALTTRLLHSAAQGQGAQKHAQEQK
jgi:hypothetical protein